MNGRKKERFPSLIRNISWLGAANVAVKPFWFLFVTAACMRLLGVSGFGVMNAALSLTMIATSFVNLGMTRYAVREVSRAPDQAPRFFSNFMVLRLGNSIVALAGALVVASVLSYQGNALLAVLFAGLYAVGLNVTAFCRGIYQALEDLRQEAVMLVVEKALVMACGLILLVTTRTAHLTLAGMAGGMVATTALNVWWVNRHFARFSLRLLSGRFLKSSVRFMIPFGLAGLFTAVYYRVDMVMIEAMLGETSAGQYGAAYRILEALIMLPAIVATAAVYPRLARLQSTMDRTGFTKLLRQSLVGLGGLSTLISVALALLAPLVIRFLDPDPAYTPAVAALQILVWSYPFFCVNSVLYAALVSVNDETFISIFLLGAVVVNVGLNLFMIPAFGINGAAYATIAPEIVLTFVYIGRMRFRMARGAMQPQEGVSERP